MKSEPQHRLIVVTHEFLEGGPVSPLRLADQHRVIDTAFLPSHAAPRGVLVFSSFVVVKFPSCSTANSLR
jgi:hypothetical protein